MVGARGSPRFTSDLGPGGGVDMGLGTRWRVRIRFPGCRQRVLTRAESSHRRRSGADRTPGRRDGRAVYAERVAAEAAVPAAVLPGLQPQRGDAARGHHALRTRCGPMMRGVHRWSIRMVGRSWCCVRTRSSRCSHW